MKRLVYTMLIAASAWGLSSYGYYWLISRLDIGVAYNDAPVLFMAYYGGWAVTVLYVFRHGFYEWAIHARVREDRILVPVMGIVFAGFSLVFVPRLSHANWTLTRFPSDLMYATSWYFLPKSVEILFQQIMIAALILALFQLKMPLLKMSIVVSVLFGAIHLTLAMADATAFYVFRYTVAAMVIGAIAPYLMLQVRNGFLIAYSVHWSFYAADLAMIHLFVRWT